MGPLWWLDKLGETDVMYRRDARTEGYQERGEMWYLAEICIILNSVNKFQIGETLLYMAK